MAKVKRLERNDWRLLWFFCAVTILAIVGLCVSCIWCSGISLFFVDIYIFYVVLYAARRSDTHKDESWWWYKYMPNRLGGVFIFVFLYAAAIVSIAGILKQTDMPGYQTDNLSAVYKSFIAIASFSYDDLTGIESLKYCDSLKYLQMLQAFNGLLLLTATFGFLISRLSSFKEKPVSADQAITVSKVITELDKKVKELETKNQTLVSEKETLETTIKNLEAQAPSKP